MKNRNEDRAEFFINQSFLKVFVVRLLQSVGFLKQMVFVSFILVCLSVTYMLFP